MRLLLNVVALVGLLAFPSFAFAQELALKRVMLSSGGLGYFEYEANVDGDATLNGVTKQITLVVDFEGALIDPYNNLRIGFSAAGEINREDFGLSWNAALETGGVVVGKQVKLEIEAEAVIPQG